MASYISQMPFIRSKARAERQIGYNFIENLYGTFDRMRFSQGFVDTDAQQWLVELSVWIKVFPNEPFTGINPINEKVNSSLAEKDILNERIKTLKESLTEQKKDREIAFTLVRMINNGADPAHLLVSFNDAGECMKHMDAMEAGHKEEIASKDKELDILRAKFKKQSKELETLRASEVGKLR